MNQDDIFKLLLIVLLTANRQLETLNEDAEKNAAASNPSDTPAPRFHYAAINDLLILAMFMQMFDYTRDPGTADETCQNRDTTF